MASIVGKRQGNRTYYYLVESKRVGGKPRIVWQRYLGPADEIIARLSAAEGKEPVRSRHLAFGDLAASWSVLLRLSFVRRVDEIVGPRRADAAASVGTYLALATLNRIVAPCSKLAFSDWWETTCGDRLVHLPRRALDHRRFWDAMDAVTVDELRAIEEAVAAAAVEAYGLDRSSLVLDMTNFATYLDTDNDATIARRGHAKQKRNDLRLVGLGLCVTADGRVPLASHPYPGDRPDVTQFPVLVSSLSSRFAVSGAGPCCVVFDAGCVSADNLALLSHLGVSYVASVPPSWHPELLGISRRHYRRVEPELLPGVSAYECRVELLGGERRVVLTHSESFHERQERGFHQTLGKALCQLASLQSRCASPRDRRSREAVGRELAEILRPRWLERVIEVSLEGEEPGSIELSYSLDRRALSELTEEIFGKRVLITDRFDWSTAEVVSAYRSQSEVEASFRQMKDTKVTSFSPMFHWTDQKIAVHAFYCTTALTVAHILVREAKRRAGLDMSVRALLHSLGGIEETLLLYPSEGGRPRARRMLTEMDPTQRRLYDLFGLERYAPVP